MRDDVCIVLNEREPLKQQMSKELIDQLNIRYLSCSTLEPTANLASILLERQPKVLILDFLLGDIATALDILTEIKSAILDETIKVILWTDEQSVQVAVNAMKLGARDFIQLHDSRSLEKLLHSIEEELQTFQVERPIPIKFNRRRPIPIAQSESFARVLALAQTQGKLNPPMVVIEGDAGCGRNTVAEHIHVHRPFGGSYIEIEYDFWAEPLSKLVGDKNRSHSIPLLSHSASVFIDHVEYDTNQLFQTIIEERANIWKNSNLENAPMLIIGTQCSKTANAWSRYFKCQRITIPTLKERSEDILPLIQAWTSIGSNRSNISQKLLPSNIFVSLLLELDWPGNIRQLRAVTIEAPHSPADYPEKNLFQAILGSFNPTKLDDLPSSEQKLFKNILVAKALWEKYNNITPFLPPQLVASRILKESAGDLRLAAAKLGTGIPQLLLALKSGNSLSGYDDSIDLNSQEAQCQN